jgi:hypothetical protein
MKTIHKRSEQQDGLPFSTLEEVADFAAEAVALIEGAGTDVEFVAGVDTEEQDYRGLTLDELRELSKALPMDKIKSFVAHSGLDGDQPVQASLSFLRPYSGPVTHFDVNGHSQVAVDGIHVWGKKAIGERFERIHEAEALAATKSQPHTQEQAESTWKRVVNHPWAVQVGGGVLAALIVAVIFLALR